MQNLTWTGTFGAYINPFFLTTLSACFIFVVAAVARGFSRADGPTLINPTPASIALLGPTAVIGLILWLLSLTDLAPFSMLGLGNAWLSFAVCLIIGIATGFSLFQISAGLVFKLVQVSFCAIIGLSATYLVIGLFVAPETTGIIGAISKQLTPTWIALIITFLVSIKFKRSLGLYGKLFDSPIGMIGLGLVLFWVFTALLGAGFDLIATHDPLGQVSGMKNKHPGIPLRGAEAGDYPYYLFGGDTLARDVFSRAVVGSGIVIVIAPAATIFAFMVGITLGLPAGYFGGRLDTVLSFLSNMVLAFPVILLFFLLVTPEIIETGLPKYLAVILFVFPVIFIGVAQYSKNRLKPNFLTLQFPILMIIAIWLYLSLVSEVGTTIALLPPLLDLFDVPSEILVVFVSVVFVNSPTVFRIVRGLTLDVKTRDYVAAAQTRGEGPWYIMLWEILPNVRGPLIVDFCLRIGYATILLGTLGFFGLGLESESPDWGTTINAGRKLLSVYLAPVLVPAFSLMSLVLGLNLLADGLREESLRD
jgi:peptide/nickel transport system permease protein